MKSFCENKYDRRKLLYHPKSIADLLEKEDTWPVTVNTGFTTYCNHSCAWCSSAYTTRINPKIKKRDQLIIDPDIWFNNIKILAQNGTKGLIIAGQGEPLLHPKAQDMLESLMDLKLKFMIFSNGERLTPKFHKAFFDSSLAVRFSVDAATEAMHTRYHAAKNTNGRGKVNFSNVLNNIESLVEAKSKLGTFYPQIGCQMICSKLTEDDFEKFAVLFKSIGVDYVVYKSLQGNIINSEISLSSFDLHNTEQERQQQAAQMIEQLMRIKKTYEDENFEVFVKVSQIQDAYVKKVNGGEHYQKCRAHPLTPMIEPDGNVYVCIDLGGDERFVMGNIYEDNIEKIWNSEKRKKIIERIDVVNRCPAGCYLDDANIILQTLITPDPALHVEFI